MRLLVLAVLLFAWFGLMALAALVPGLAPKALAIAPGAGLIDNMPADIRLVRAGRHSAVVASARPGHVHDLYAAGAWLVFPSLANGCLSLR